MPDTEHLPNRPFWDCKQCLKPWPCKPAREQLAAEHVKFPSVLALYMDAQRSQARLDMAQLGYEAPADLYERFLGWVRRPISS